jgi:hypothetical protein
LARQFPGISLGAPVFEGTEVFIAMEPFTQLNVENNRVRLIYHQPGATTPRIYDDFNIGYLRIDAPTSIDEPSKPVWATDYPLLLKVCSTFHSFIFDLLRSRLSCNASHAFLF